MLIYQFTNRHLIIEIVKFILTQLHIKIIKKIKVLNKIKIINKFFIEINELLQKIYKKIYLWANKLINYIYSHLELDKEINL